MEYHFTRVVDFDTLDTFKNATKCSGYGFACGNHDAVLIRRPTQLFSPLKCALPSDALKAIRNAQKQASRMFDTYIYVQLTHDEFEVFKCESEDKEETIVSAFKDWCAQNGYKF